MKANSPTSAETALWERVIRLEGQLPAAAARALLKVRFSPQDQERMRQLSAKARAGQLSPQEQVEIDAYERLGCLLDILHSQARRALKRRRTAS
jgi:hypothetical protein